MAIVLKGRLADLQTSRPADLKQSSVTESFEVHLVTFIPDARSRLLLMLNCDVIHCSLKSICYLISWYDVSNGHLFSIYQSWWDQRKCGVEWHCRDQFADP